jgi:hypothetical protein
MGLLVRLCQVFQWHEEGFALGHDTVGEFIDSHSFE